MNVDDQAMDWATLVPPRQEGAGGTGRLEYLSHLLERHRQMNPVGHVFLRGNGKERRRLADQREARGAARCLAPGARPCGAEKIAEEMQLQAFQDVPYIPLGQYFVPTAYQANLTGILPGNPVFWNIRRS